MLRAIVRKEFLGHVLTLRFAVGTAFCLALFVASALVLRADYADRVQAYQAAAAGHREELAQAKFFSMLSVGVDRPPAPLSLLCQGVDRNLPSSCRYSITDAPTLADAGTGRNPLLVVFPGLDLAVIVQVVMSLLALLFAYDAVSGERERGTLALALSNAVPRATLLLGKYLGGLAVLLPLLAAGMAVSLAILLTSRWVTFGATEWLAIGTIGVVSAVYLSLIFLVGLLVSTLARRSGTSLTASLFLWVVLVLLAPQAAVATAAAMRPLPAGQQQQARERDVKDAAWNRILDYARKHPRPMNEERFTVFRGSMHSGSVPMLSRLWFGPREYVQWARDGLHFSLPILMEAAEKTHELRLALSRTMASQGDLARGLGRLTPSGAFYGGLTALADTDARRFLRFQSAVTRHRAQVIEFARANEGLDYRFFTHDGALDTPTLAELDALAGAGDTARLATLTRNGYADLPAIDVSSLPAFAMPEAALPERLAAALPDLALLAVLNLLLLGATALVFARADVRCA